MPGNDEVIDRGDEVIVTPSENIVPPDDKQEDEGVAPVTGDVLDEDVETPEEKEERERLEAEEAKKRNIRIPKARFDEAQAKARAREQALLDQIEAMKNGQKSTATQRTLQDVRSQIDELQDKYEDLIMDGKKDEARKIRKQVEAMRDDLIEFQTSSKSEAARAAAIEDLSYSAQLANFETQYPALNPDNDAFDEERTGEVATLLQAFVQTGARRADALAKAVKYVFGAAAATSTSDAGRMLAEERARKAREKAADANRRQPAGTSGVGLDSDKAGKMSEMGIDVMRMSQDKFAKLDDETKARLRGDII